MRGRHNDVPQALFEGLVFDEYDNPVRVTYVGSEPCYVVDDAGFLRHIPSEQVDRQVLENLEQLIARSENAISEQAAQMLGVYAAMASDVEAVMANGKMVINDGNLLTADETEILFKAGKWCEEIRNR